MRTLSDCAMSGTDLAYGATSRRVYKLSQRIRQTPLPASALPASALALRRQVLTWCMMLPDRFRTEDAVEFLLHALHVEVLSAYAHAGPCPLIT
eukprot:3052681-Rhodomonas_salina.1